MRESLADSARLRFMVARGFGLLFLLFAQACLAAPTAQSLNVVGRWQVEFKFEDGIAHSLRFEADAPNTGSLLLLDPRSNLSEPARSTPARWQQTGERVTFSGPVEFAIGNVGREAGTLVFDGSVRTRDHVSGLLAFFPEGQDPADPAATPSKKGTFTAVRLVPPAGD